MTRRHTPGLSLILLLAGATAAAGPRLGRFTIDAGKGQFLVDGKPFQVISGEMHYLRIPPEYWRDRLMMARAMGLNSVATYVFWNMHEPRRGEWDFRDGHDLARFVKTAQDVGLYVILRPGPYACAEWEFGGYPAWLLEHQGIAVRSMDERYLQASERYLMRLGKEMAPLQNTRGGPIIMVQFENEYGEFGNDKVYLRRVREMIKRAGFEVPLFTSDVPQAVANGYLPEALPALNGSTGQAIFSTVKKYWPNGPFLVAEFYSGWLDHWGERHAHVDAAKTAGQLDWMLSHGVSVNFYMFHGGTSFGFMNGANYDDHYQPQPTSYDYDAPLDEAGRPTAKYQKFREIIRKHLPADVKIPDVPPAEPVIAISRFELNETARLLDNLPTPVRSQRPLAMEAVGQAYGYILYRTRINAAAAGPLVITDLRDYGVILLNGRSIAALDRRLKQNSIGLSVSQVPATLDILVENGGRINFGPELVRNRKGITERVTLAGKELTGWETFPLPMARVSGLRFKQQESASGPTLHRGTFEVQAVGDTFLDMRGWGKGCVFVNGHNLGRFWRIGPQQTLYLPGVWLKMGANEIVVLEMEDHPQRSIEGLRNSILDQFAPEAGGA